MVCTPETSIGTDFTLFLPRRGQSGKIGEDSVKLPQIPIIKFNASRGQRSGLGLDGDPRRFYRIPSRLGKRDPNTGVVLHDSVSDVEDSCIPPRVHNLAPCRVNLGQRFRNSINSTGAPLSTIIAARTPSEGELAGLRMFFPFNASSMSSTSKAICGTVLTSSEMRQSGSNRIHSMPYGLVSNPATWILRCLMYRSPGFGVSVGMPR